MFTNNSGVSLPLAVWLASTEGYDRKFDPNVISVTELIKPIRSIVLTRQMMMAEVVEGQDMFKEDITERVASRMGHALHSAVEHSWKKNYVQAMQNLDFPESTIKRIKINPKTVTQGDLPVFLENRSEKQFGRYTLSGKYDLVLDGAVRDIKSTKTYTWIKGSNNRNYTLQGSIYRVLNPQIITQDIMYIDYIFTDWSPISAKSDPKYPKHRAMSKALPLMSVPDTEQYIRERLALIEKHMTNVQDDLPYCSPEELWQDPTRYAYYKDPAKTTRATKLFDSLDQAHVRNAADGGKGMIQKRESTPTFCMYCNARTVCDQAKKYMGMGLL